MTAAVVETDIDRFIRDQKSKLAHERRALAEDGNRRERSQSPETKRRLWDKSTLGDHRLAEQTNSRSLAGTERTGLPIGESQNEARRKQLQAERNREYNEMVQKKAVPNRRPPPTPDNMAPRPIPTTDRPDPRGRGAVRQSQNDAPPQRRKEQQLESSLEDIHKREEHLRRSLDEDQIREADQEHTLREERWRRQGVDRAPPKKIEEKPRYYRAREEERNPDRTYRARHAQYPLDGRQDRGTQKPPAPPNRRIWREPSGDENIGLPIGEYERKKQELAAQRKREMQENISKNQPTSRRQWQEAEHTGLKLTSENPAARFNEEKRRDYNEDISKKPVRNRRWREPSANGAVLFIPEREKAEEQLLREKQKQKQLHDRRADLPPKPATPGGFLNRLGRDNGRKEQLGDERRREYNQFMAEKSTRGGAGRRDQGEYSNGIAGLRDANSAKYRYPERPKSDSDVRGSWSKPWFERNRSYVDFKPFSRHGYQHRPPDLTDPQAALVASLAKQRHGEYYTTLPGLNYENTKSLQSEYERNREYNEFLRQKAVREMSIRAQAQDVPPDNPRRGWATPTYEEMLQQKRQEEARYRRFDDPEYKRPGMKSYGSEGALNGIDAPRRGKDLDLDLDRRLRLDEGRRSILEDPLWLSPRRAEIYDKEFNSGPPQYPDPPRHAPAPARHARDPDYYATLPVGQDERMSAQQRKKEQYRHELEKQMQEAAENKRREKLEDLKVSATGAKDPQMRDERPRALGVNAPPPPYIAPPPTQLMGPIPAAPIVAPVPAQAPVYKIVDPTPVYTTRVADYDKLSPRSELVLGRKSLYTGDNQWDQIKQLDRINFDLDRSKYDIPSSNSGGILERGFDALLEPPRVPSIQPPPGLEYKPMTFITGGGVGSLSSVDDAYYLLGQKNPLEPEIVGAAQPRVQAAAPVMAAGAAAAGPNVVPAGRVRFNDEAPRRQPPGGGVTFAEDGNDKAAARAKAQAYQLELAKQIEEAKTKKARAKAEQDWYDMKLEQEAKDYNPYGKGGGGAPMKDDQGNTMADLRAMKKGYQTGAGYSAFSSSPRPPPPRDDMIKTPPSQTTALGDVTHARGGHGIFGMPKTEAEKHQSNVYKDDLQRQIEARKAAAAREREKERYEEEKEMRRIEAERKKMQDEYEEERKKIKAKEDEARRKNEELMRQAEERKREAEQRRRDAEDERRRQQEEADRERLERERATRTASPPIPAVTRKQATEPLERGKSPAEPGPSSQRAPSADILNALARMKHQLASERDRVENMLDKNDNEPEVFDARLAQRPPPVPRQHDIDVFERARNRSTVPVRRAPTVNEHPPNPSYLNEFNILKHADTDSRQEFKRHYPYEPMSNDNLEQQQAALIRQQEEGLRAMRDKSRYEKALPHMDPKDLGLARHQTLSPQPMLHSNSAFIDMNGLGPVFPDDLDDLPRRNDSARQRRRDRLFSSPRPGSVTSLDVDQIARKNEQRLKKLRDMQGDDLSMNDPDDVLDRFVSKQSHHRPPTSQTLQDDSWLQAGSKLSRY